MKQEELISRYRNGTLTDEQLQLLEGLIENGDVNLAEIEDISHFHQALEHIQIPEPSVEMTERFYTLLAEQKVSQRSRQTGVNLSNWWIRLPALRWAYSVALVALGLAAGWLINGSQVEKAELQHLSAEVTQMKELMMLTLLEEESISDRLKAVNLTSELPDASHKVVEALLHTLNNDDNVNVRLAALEALYVYSENAQVRQGLILSISRQESPLVQMALAEMMVAMQEKKSIEAFKELLDKDETAVEVKDRIEESLKVLI